MSEKCGTYAGYVGGCRCDDCKSAAADYARWYRETHPSYRVANAIRVNARRRAALRLANEHPERFAELIEQELATASSNPSDGARTAIGDAAGLEHGEAGVVGSPARTAQATGARAAGLSPDMTKGAARNSAPVETTTAS